MSRNDNDEAAFWLVGICLLLVAAFVYFQVKAFADWVGLDWGSAAYLLGGIITAAAAVIGAIIQGWSIKKLSPWIFCGFYLFTLPALNCWAQLEKNPFHMSRINADLAWYGNGWVQFLIFVALVGGAYGLNKWVDEY
jgi:hypothetical protein